MYVCMHLATKNAHRHHHCIETHIVYEYFFTDVCVCNIGRPINAQKFVHLTINIIFITYSLHRPASTHLLSFYLIVGTFRSNEMYKNWFNLIVSRQPFSLPMLAKYDNEMRDKKKKSMREPIFFSAILIIWSSRLFLLNR